MSRVKVGPGRFTGGAQKGLLTVASSRIWRGSGVSAAPDPPGRALRIPYEGKNVKDFDSRNFFGGSAYI